MPTYEYACGACGHKFEEFQSITAKPTVKCPKCGKRKVKRLISAGGGFIFKGSGFYITDYRSDSYKEAAKNDTAPAKTDTAKTETTAAKTDAAPAKGDSAPAKAAPAAPSAPAKSESKSESKSSGKSKK